MRDQFYNDGYIDYHYIAEFDLEVFVNSHGDTMTLDVTSNFASPLETFHTYCDLLDVYDISEEEETFLKTNFKKYMITTLAVDPKDLEEEE